MTQFSRVIAITADRLQVVDGNVGGGEPAVSSRMVWTVTKKYQNSLLFWNHVTSRLLVFDV